MFNDGHPVLGQGTGFIAAYNLCTAKRFDCRQPTDNSALFAHFGNTDGKYDGNNRCQTFRDSGDCQRYRDHKGREDGVEVKTSGGNQVEEKDKDTDAQHNFGQRFSKTCQLLLKRSLFIDGRGECTGNFTHLGLHTGFCDDHFSAAVGNRRTHITHVFPVTERDIVFLVQPQCVNHLVYRDAFTGQCSFFYFQGSCFDDSAICRDAVASFQYDDIAWNQL